MYETAFLAVRCHAFLKAKTLPVWEMLAQLTGLSYDSALLKLKGKKLFFTKEMLI